MKACFVSVTQTAKHTHCFFSLWKDVRRVCDVPGGHKSMPRVCDEPYPKYEEDLIQKEEDFQETKKQN